MIPRSQEWRRVRHPVMILMRGWRRGRGCLVSPRGTVFVIRLTKRGLVARKRMEFQLTNEA